MIVKCFNCEKEINKNPKYLRNSKSGKVFCSKTCAAIVNNAAKRDTHHHNYTNGEYSYRDRAFRELKQECVRCGYNAIPQMLDVDHIDSNRKNNGIENLQILCVWCHALKTRNIPV